MAEKQSEERRQRIVINRRDNDRLRIALTSVNTCVHGPRAAVATAGAPFVDESARLVAVIFIDFHFPFRETEDDRCRGARLSVDLRPLLSTPG